MQTTGFEVGSSRCWELVFACLLKKTLNSNLTVMKRLFFLLGIVAMILGSCTQELPGPDPDAPQDVIFTSANAGGLLKSEQDCNNPDADYAMVTIDGTIYYPATFYVGGVLYTQAIKLAPGTHVLGEFILFNDNGTPNDKDDDIIVRASPQLGSEFGSMVINPMSMTFEVFAFQKVEIPVEVLCFEKSSHGSFGFVWFKPDVIRVKEKWFFGDLCTEVFEQYAGSLYGDFPRVDMPAIFKIEVLRDDDLNGTYENLLGTYDNEDGYENNEDYASVPPLSINYPDRTGIEDSFELKVYIYMMIGTDITTGYPVFGYNYYGSWYFSDDSDEMYTDPAHTTGVFVQGDDGIYDFVVGFCIGDEIDVVVPDPDDPQGGDSETAFAYGGEGVATCFRELGFSRWGWTNLLNPTGSYELPIYAGAGQCDISKGTLVGTLEVEFLSSTSVRVRYLMDTGFTLVETHLYIGTPILPIKNGTYYTVAPGQYPYKHEALGDASSDTYELTIPTGPVYLVAHSVVRGF